MAGNFFISIAMATALQHLWAMINAMQIIVLGVFFDCYWPPNAQIILISLLKSCSFDLFQTESIYTEIFGFKDSESFSDLFDEAGI